MWFTLRRRSSSSSSSSRTCKEDANSDKNVITSWRSKLIQSHNCRMKRIYCSRNGSWHKIVLWRPSSHTINLSSTPPSPSHSATHDSLHFIRAANCSCVLTCLSYVAAAWYSVLQTLGRWHSSISCSNWTCSQSLISLFRSIQSTDFDGVVLFFRRWMFIGQRQTLGLWGFLRL